MREKNHVPSYGSIQRNELMKKVATDHENVRSQKELKNKAVELNDKGFEKVSAGDANPR